MNDASDDRPNVSAPMVVTDPTAGGQGLDFWREAAGSIDAIVDAAARDDRERLIDERPAGVIIDGDDRLVSRVLTAVRRRFGRRARVPVEPLDVGTFGSVARSVGARSSDAVRGALTDGSDWLQSGRRRLPLLRVTSSAEPAPLWGTTFGAGAWFKLTEIVQRGGGRVGDSLRSALRSAMDALGGTDASQWRSEGARVTVDREPWGETIGHLIASSLSSSWLGLELASDGGAGWLGDETVGRLARQVAESRIPGFGGRGGERFDQLHFNWRAGFVLDGRLIDAGVPHAVEVAPAEAIEVVDG